MILQNSKLAGLSLGADRAIPETGDSEIRTPAVMLDAVPIPFAHMPKAQPSAGTATVADTTSSSISGFHRTLAAAAGAEVTRLWNVTQGLWKLHVDYWVLFPSGTITQFNLLDLYGDPNVGMHTSGIFEFTAWNPNIWPFFGQMDKTILIPKNHVYRATLNLDNTGGTSPMGVSFNWNFSRLA